MKTFVVFLRGINVGGHHKVPMADLREVLGKMGYYNIKTLLNSGNIILESNSKDRPAIEAEISKQLEKHYGFAIPTIVIEAQLVEKLIENEPFKGIELTKDLRFYISILKHEIENDLDIPWQSEDASFRILGKIENSILSVLDLSKSKTPKAMEILEKFYKKENITTRNWNTILRLSAELKK